MDHLIPEPLQDRGSLPLPELGAETGVHAGAESQVRIRVPVEVEVVRLGNAAGSLYAASRKGAALPGRISASPISSILPPCVKHAESEYTNGDSLRTRPGSNPSGAAVARMRGG